MVSAWTLRQRRERGIRSTLSPRRRRSRMARRLVVDSRGEQRRSAASSARRRARRAGARPSRGTSRAGASPSSARCARITSRAGCSSSTISTAALQSGQPRSASSPAIRVANVGEQRVELRARIAVMLRDDGVPPVPETLRLILEDLDDEVFLRLEHAIERDLGRVGFRRDRVDAHAANAESIEELLRRIEDSIARAATGVARFVIEERRVRRKFVLRG